MQETSSQTSISSTRAFEWPSARHSFTLTCVDANAAVLFGGVDRAGTLCQVCGRSAL
jgi:hypothetical protein